MNRSERLLGWVLGLALGMAAGTLHGEPVPEFPRVDDTSREDPVARGQRMIQLSVDVPAPTDAVWKAFSTEEGWRSFAVAFARVDFRTGGILETSYRAEAKEGDPDNIKNQIVAYVPGRMLAIRCVQTPKTFEHKEEFFQTVTVLEFKPIEGGTRVLGTSTGFGPGAAFDDLFKRFRLGNAYTLEKLRAHFDSAPPKKQSAPQSPVKPPEN